MTGDNSVTTGCEAALWEMVDALRGSMDAGDYKHVVLGLIFLKYVSDAFEETRAQLEAAATRAPTPITPTGTSPATSSGCPSRRAGRCCKRRPASPPSGRRSTKP